MVDVIDLLAAVEAPADEGSPYARLGVVGRIGRLEAQANSNEAAILGQLEQLSARLEAAHSSSMEVVGLLAGQVVARVDDIAVMVDVALKARNEALTADIEATLSMYHEELVARFVAAQTDMTDLVTRLLSAPAAVPTQAEPSRSPADSV